jgi:hypothetical protein
VFKLIVAPILHGAGICLPSSSDCESIDLGIGQVEELEYVEPDGQTVSYALKVVAINKVVLGANAAALKHGAHSARAKHNAAHAASAANHARLKRK